MYVNFWINDQLYSKQLRLFIYRRGDIFTFRFLVGVQQSFPSAYRQERESRHKLTWFVQSAEDWYRNSKKKKKNSRKSWNKWHKQTPHSSNRFYLEIGMDPQRVLKSYSDVGDSWIMIWGSIVLWKPGYRDRIKTLNFLRGSWKRNFYEKFFNTQ